jgi:hypothetical protein
MLLLRFSAVGQRPRRGPVFITSHKDSIVRDAVGAEIASAG